MSGYHVCTERRYVMFRFDRLFDIEELRNCSYCAAILDRHRIPALTSVHTVLAGGVVVTATAMGDVAALHDKSQEVEADLQAFDDARGKAGNVTELFDILKGKLRPERKGERQGVGKDGLASSSHSTLQALYYGSESNTVLSTANLQRIQAFLDEPQKHLGQVMADIEQESGSFYGEISSHKKRDAVAGVQRMQRGAREDLLVKDGKRICLEEVPEMNKYLGPNSRFGDGDGSFWDRWLTTTGYFTEHGNYATANMPKRSMYSHGSVPPYSGFKRYQLDKLSFLQNPDPRVLTYAARRELGDVNEATTRKERLFGANSEIRERRPVAAGPLLKTVDSHVTWVPASSSVKLTLLLSLRWQERLSPRTRHWLDNVVQTTVTAASDVDRLNKNGGKKSTNKTQDSSRTSASLRDRGFRDTASGESGLLPARQRSESMSSRSSWTVVVQEEAAARACAASSTRDDRNTPSDVGKGLVNGPIPGLDMMGHPNYFGRQARTDMYEYFKQVSRRRHQYGKRKSMAVIPLTPEDYAGITPAYKSGVASGDPEGFTEKQQGSRRGRRLPALDSSVPGGDTQSPSRGGLITDEIGVAEGESIAGSEDHEEEDDADILHLHEAGKIDQLTSRTKYLVRCMEANVAPRAHMIIRKTHTTKVNLAHQGMGDVMGGILADCLIGLPLMRELNLRDNRLTDKGLIPIVKAIKQRLDLHALDLSENKLDRWAARELALYFSNPRATLAKFVLSKADVDDFEAANFVKHMRMNKTLTYLDISRNLIGSQESINYVQPQFYTGAEALADWIATESCPLKHLDVSWNTIRLDSAVYFGNALASAKNLIHLDLSYNCFGAKGGEAIGASLHLNSTLQTLGLASNALNPRACFVICQGLRCNTSIRSINMSNNSLGKIGVGCVMALPAELGDRLKVIIAHCNFMVGCEECWFDDEKLQPWYELRMDEPYDRAVACHLMRRAARDDGLKMKRVTHTMPGEAAQEIAIVKGTPPTESSLIETATLEEIFAKYDVNDSGSLDRDELAEALRDLGLGTDNQVDLVLSRYDSNGSGTIEEAEFHEFVESRMNQSRKREDRSKAFMAEASNPGKRWMVPPEGKLRLEMDYHRLHNQSCHTSVDNADGLLAMLSGIVDGRADVMNHALDSISLDTDQGLTMYSAVLKHMGGDVIKTLAKVIPRMESPSDARLLKNTVLRDLDERRKLRHELGPAYRPLMGLPMGRYELDMARPIHRLAARKVAEYNNVEKMARQAEEPSAFDASQKASWENVRNETANGKTFRFRSENFEAPPNAGTLEFDYVSTARRQTKNASGSDQERVMSARRFQQMLLALGLGDEAEWATMGEQEFDQAVDAALNEFPPRPRTPKLFEYLHFLMTGETSVEVKKPIPSRPSAMGRQGTGGVPKQSGPRLLGKPRSDKNSSSVSDTGNVEGGDPAGNSLTTTGSLGSMGVGMNMGTSVKISAMACRLDELLADRWFSVRQCRFLVILIQEVFVGDEFLQDVMVDFVVTVHPRIVDIYNYMSLAGSLEDRSQAFVIKRVGWLAAWNPCCPDGYVELALDRREERQVAKMLVHLAVAEAGDNWASCSFRWSMFDTPTPGWALSRPWQTEEGMLHKGMIGCNFRSLPGSENWPLRIALTQTVTLCDISGMAAAAASRQGQPALLKSDGKLKRSNSYAMNIHQDGLDGLEQSMGREDFDLGALDTELIDALCRENGNDFFLYGS